MKFRKKPVVVEAEQLRTNPDGAVYVPDGVNFGWPCDDLHETHPLSGKYWVQTLEGPLIASHRDWIVTGVKGERYPVKPDIFEATYEAVTDEGDHMHIEKNL